MEWFFILFLSVREPTKVHLAREVEVVGPFRSEVECETMKDEVKATNPGWREVRGCWRGR